MTRLSPALAVHRRDAVRAFLLCSFDAEFMARV
jgi:hypothetical protein